MYSRFKNSLSLILFGLLTINHADATQFIDNSDKQSVQVNISAREANRLSVEGRRVATAVPAQSGIINVQKDENHGVFYFTLAADSPAPGPVSMFVTDDQKSAYKLILVPRPIAAEDIVVRPSAEKVNEARKIGAAEGRAASYQRRVKDLILMMAGEELGESSVDKVELNIEVPLWKEGRLILAFKYLELDLVGEKYRLTNVSAADMLLVEQELFRRGVRAVSIKHHTLTPGDATDIYIVRERKDNE